MFNLKKIKWKKGASELISFAIVLPFVMLLIMGIVAITQLALTRISLEQAAYTGCRAAVVSQNKTDAKIAGENAAKMALGSITFGVPQDSIVVTLNVVAGITDPASGNVSPKWVKGSMVEFIVEAKVDNFLNFLPDTMKTSICMMIEQPAKIY